jgi:hypothetical protein
METLHFRSIPVLESSSSTRNVTAGYLTTTTNKLDMQDIREHQVVIEDAEYRRWRSHRKKLTVQISAVVWPTLGGISALTSGNFENLAGIVFFGFIFSFIFWNVWLKDKSTRENYVLNRMLCQAHRDRGVKHRFYVIKHEDWPDSVQKLQRP